MILIGVLAGLTAGAALVYFMLKGRHRQALEEVRQSREAAFQDFKAADGARQEAERSLAAAQSRLESTIQTADEWRRRSELQSGHLNEVTADLGKARTEIRHLEERLSEERAKLEEVNQKLTAEFENVASRILDEKSKRFTEMNSERLGEIIRPFRDKLQEFEAKVDSTNREQNEGRAALFERLRSLEELNKTIGDEALNLTRALRGDSKVQGDWGEMVLERILQSSGLLEGTHYNLQESFSTEEGRYRPDAIIRLPDSKHLVIDSKVSLKAYSDWVASIDPSEKDRLRRDHFASVKAHMMGLSGKNYENIEGLSTPAFVIMFVPNDAAFLLAMQHDNTLYDQGYKQRVVIVSPSNLMGLMMTVDHLWKQESQQKNMMEIVRLGESMLDKFNGFVDALDQIGERLGQAEKAYHDARGRLFSGRGNLVSLANRLSKLGLKTKKSLPEAEIPLLPEHAEGAFDEPFIDTAEEDAADQT